MADQSRTIQNLQAEIARMRIDQIAMQKRIEQVAIQYAQQSSSERSISTSRRIPIQGQTYYLDGDGTCYVADIYSKRSSSGARKIQVYTPDDGSSSSAIQLTKGGEKGFMAGIDTDDFLKIHPGYVLGSATGLLMDENGNVGIGVTGTPAGKLEVNGYTKLGGNEVFKIYTPNQTLVSGDITAHQVNMDVTSLSITLSKVRSLTCVGYDVSAANVIAVSLSDDAGAGTHCRFTSATNLRVYFGTDYVVNDRMCVTVIIAQ